MKVKPSSLLECIHLDPNYLSLTAQNMMAISESFHLLDVHGDELLNDCQVKIWMKHHTDLNKMKRDQLFELIDIYNSGFFDLDNFYFFTSLMLAVKDGVEKEYINRHARSLYNLFEVRMKGKMTMDQFEMLGWLFGFDKRAVESFKKEFDIGPYKKIYMREFKLFLLTVMEMEEILDRLERVRAYEDYRKRLIWTLQKQLVDYVKYDKLPPPEELINTIHWIQRPYLRRGKGVRRLNLLLRIRKYFTRQFLMRMGQFTKGTGAHKGCKRCRKFVIKYVKIALRIETPKDKELKRKKEQELERKKGGKKKKKRGKSKKCRKCLTCRCCRKKKRTVHVWGDDQRMVGGEDKHDEVSVASQMPSWIQWMDEEEEKRKHKPKLALLDDVLEEDEVDEKKLNKKKRKEEEKRAKEERKKQKEGAKQEKKKSS